MGRIFYGWLLLLLLSSLSTLTAQTELIFGDSLIGEKGIVSQPMPDGTIWVVGMTQSGPYGGNDILAVHIDSIGNFITPIQYYGTAGLDYPNNMIYRNGRLIIAGERHDNGNVDAFILQLDTVGTVLSYDHYGQPNETEQFYDIKGTQDGGFVVTGFGASPTTTGNNFLLSKFNAAGQQEWMQIHDLGTNEIGVAVVETPDGGYLVAGDQLQFGGNYNVKTIKCDAMGNLLWNRTVYSPYNGGCKQMVVMGDQVVIVGEMATATSFAFDVYMIRMDWQGNVLFQQTISKTNNGDAAFDVAVKDNNTIYVTGYLFDGPTSNTNLFVMALDSMGQILDEKQFGGNNFDMGYDIKLLSNNRFIITGFTSRPYNQVYVIFDQLSIITATNKPLQSNQFFEPIYPNPTTEIAQIPNALQKYTIKVFSLLGQPVLTYENGSDRLSLASLSKGMYVVAFYNEDGDWVEQQRLIKE